MEKISKLLSILGLSIASALSPIAKAQERTPAIEIRYFVDNIPGDIVSQEFYKEGHGIWPQIEAKVENAYKKQGIDLDLKFVTEMEYLFSPRNNLKIIPGIYTSEKDITTKRLRQLLTDIGSETSVGRINAAIQAEQEKGTSEKDAEQKILGGFLKPLMNDFDQELGIACTNAHAKTFYTYSFNRTQPTNLEEGINLAAHVIGHETGHVVGLPHYTNSTDNLMYPYMTEHATKGDALFNKDQLATIKENTK